jgi:hypothetical protein
VNDFNVDSTCIAVLSASNRTLVRTWHIESDVFYAGPWIEFFADEGNDTSTDFVSASVKQGVLKDKWRSHLNNCKVNGKGCRDTTTYQAGWQIARLSARLARDLWSGVEERRIVGHHEAVVYPLCVQNNFTLRQIDQLKVSYMIYGGSKEAIKSIVTYLLTWTAVVDFEKSPVPVGHVLN